MLVFLNPIYLWGLAALSIPLALHLFQRRRTVVVPFPTLRFLKLAQKRSASRVRFENLLLWLLRSLLLALLALAFAMPVLRKSRAGNWLARGRRDVVIVIDTSYSMAYETDRGAVIDTARGAAEELIGSLAPADRVCIYLAAETPRPLIERPTTEHAAALQALRGVTWHHGSSAIDAAIAQALHTLDQEKDTRPEREIYVLTDGQARPWHGFRSATDDHAPSSDGSSVIAREHRDRIPLYVLLGGAERPENTWPASVTLTPPLLLAGQEARLTAKIGRTGPARQLSLVLSCDGAMEPLNRSVLAGADSETPVELVLPALPPGLWPAELRTTTDALPCDDALGFMLRVRDRLPVLVAGPPGAVRYLSAALAPGGGDAVTVVAPDELGSVDLAGYEALFLADALPLSGQAILAIESYVKAGGILAVFAGDGAAPGAYGDLPFLPAPVRGVAQIPVREAVRHIGRVSREDAIFRDFRFPQGVVPTLALKRVLLFDPPAPGGTVVLTAGDDQPFLLVRPLGRGLVFQFAVSAGRDWSTLPLTAFFVPVVHQIVRHGAGVTRQSPAAPLQTELPVDEYLPDFRADDRLYAPSGQEIPVRDAGNLVRVVEPLAEPGLYTRRRAGGEPVPALFANPARDESRLDPVTPEELEAWTGFKTLRVERSPEALLAAAAEQHHGRELTELLLWLILPLALDEWWFANRTLRQGTRLTESLAIDPAGKVTGTATT